MVPKKEEKRKKEAHRFVFLTFLLVLLSFLQSQSLSAAMISMYSWNEIFCHPTHLLMDLPIPVAEAHRIEAVENKKNCFVPLTTKTEKIR